MHWFLQREQWKQELSSIDLLVVFMSLLFAFFVGIFGIML